MSPFRLPAPAILAVSFAALGLAACSSMPNFGSPSEPPPVPEVQSQPSRYSAEEFVGRWGFTSYQKPSDRGRTEVAARGQCRQPYVIGRGPNGGILMHLADDKEKTEQVLKGSADGKNYIGPPGDAGVPQDREIISFDGRVLITRYVDPDAGTRYGNMVYVRCGPRA
jgi:hypothetical protein